MDIFNAGAKFLSKAADAIGADGLADAVEATRVGLGGEKDPCGIKKSSDGRVTADIDYSELPKESVGDLKHGADKLATLLSSKKEELGKCSDPQKKSDLERDISKLENGLADIKYHCEVGEFGLGEVLLGALLPGFGFILADMLIDTKADAGDAQTALAAANKNTQAINLESAPSPPLMKKSGAMNPSSESSAVDGSSKAGNANGDAKTGAELRHMMRTDPAAFQAYMDGNTSASAVLQDYLQTQNQFWSMMTNSQKAEHDTKKAIIGNMRV